MAPFPRDPGSSVDPGVPQPCGALSFVFPDWGVSIVPNTVHLQTPPETTDWNRELDELSDAEPDEDSQAAIPETILPPETPGLSPSVKSEHAADQEAMPNTSAPRGPFLRATDTPQASAVRAGTDGHHPSHASLTLDLPTELLLQMLHGLHTKDWLSLSQVRRCVHPLGPPVPCRVRV
jgi:hypothetical protein